MSKREAVVMGRNYSSLLGMCRCAGEAGCEVSVIRLVKRIPKKTKMSRYTIDRKSKYVVDYDYAVEPDEEALIKKLLKKFAGKKNVILLPTDDFVAEAIDQNIERLKDIFVFPNIGMKQNEVCYWMDKGNQKKWATECGLNSPKGWSVAVKDGNYTMIDDVIYPCFTKPQTAIDNRKRYMKRCNNKEELKELLDNVAANVNCDILIEQFVVIEKEYGVCGFSNGTDVVCPSLVYKEMTGSGSHEGVTLLGHVMDFDKYPDLQNKIKTFIRKLGFVGLFDIDLYEADGVMYFCELNMRLGAFGYAVNLAGVNLPGLLVETLLGNPVNTDCHIQKQLKCLNDKVNLEDFADKYVSWETYKKRLKDADARFIDDPKDAGPKRFYTFEVFKQWVRHFQKK
ncbi:MAG: ATP-grasp domain-containing protein [Erysipelotrichaceae bacterium]|nr:ATP-grasp domain-containing protein [Erysipelotrichaceae bacterium]